MTKSHRWRVLKRETYLKASPDSIESGVSVFQIDGMYRTSSSDELIPFYELGSDSSGAGMAISGPCETNQAGFCTR